MIPKVKNWRVKLVNENDKLVRQVIVRTINKRFAVWCAQELGLWIMEPGQRYIISLDKNQSSLSWFADIDKIDSSN